MSESMTDTLFGVIIWTHNKLLAVTNDLSPEQMFWRPGPQAPPISWHLWHTGRFADIVFAGFPDDEDGPRRQIWETEELALRWELDPSTLGPVQGGEGMAYEDAVELPHQIGLATIREYAQQAFSLYKDLESRPTSEEMDRLRPSPSAYRITDDLRIVSDPTKQSQLGSDLVWHVSHMGRHLGMIEALIGAQGGRGTASA